MRDIFNEGVISGQYSAIHGLDIFPPCIDTEEHEYFPPESELALDAAGFVVEVAKDVAVIASAAFSMAFMTLANVALAARHFTHTHRRGC